MAKKDQLIQSITGRSQNTGSSSGSSGGSSWSGGSSGGMTKKEQLLNSVDSWHASPNTASNVYSPAQWAAEQAARNQQWREEQAAAQAQQKVGLWKDTTIQSNDEREQLMAEYRRIQNSNSIPMVRRKNEIRNRLEELDRELGNQEMYYGTDRVSGALGGAVTGWLGQQGSFLGKSAEALSRLGERLGGNTSDYAGWATDELSAGQIGNENDAAKRAQQVAEAQAMATWGGSMQDRASGNVQKAKSGLGKVGQVAVDVGVNATQMLLDRATGLPMPALYTRAAGGAMHEAEQVGASLKQQLLYGNTIGAVEAGTEMLTGGLAKIYGKGTADGLIESAVRKMARSDVGRKALLVLSDMGGEAFEELLSGVVQPAVQTIYNGQTIGQSYRENFDASEVLYDALIGGLMGGFGAGMKGVTGDYSQAAQRMSYTDQAQEALQAQWGTDRAGRRAAQDYAEIIARGMTGEATRADLRKLETRPTAQSVMEQMVTRETGETQNPVSNVLRQAFEASGIEVSDEDMRLLSDGYVPGTDVTSYVQAVRDGYRMGRSGNFTLEQAMQNSSAAAGVDPVQFRHAFELGQGTVSAEADTADVTTEEGRTKMTARLASLGPRAEAAAEVYEGGQDVASFASAMEKAVNLYAANGANLQEIYDAEKAGRSTDIIGRLTPKQIERAAALGAQVREENTQRAQSRAAEFKQIQEQAAQIRQESDAKLGEINAAIFQVQDHINAVQQELNGTLEGLGAARAAQPDIVNTQEYKDAMGRVNQMRDDLKSTRQILNQLQKERIKARQKNPGKRKKGTVSYEGGSIEGRKVKGVDRKNMTRQQKKAAALVESVADAIGLDFVLFDGEANVGGAYIQGGTVYINVNSSIKVGDVQKSIVGASLSHELTHYMQQYAPEEYQELKNYIINEVLKVSPDELTRLVENERRWHQSQGVLSYNQALDEVIANACQTMLYDSKAIRKLARENMTLAQKIADVIEEIAEKIKAAFDEVDINDAELFRGVRDIAAELDRVQELWDKGIEAATRNLDTAGTKKAATEGGEVQYQVAEREEILHLQDQIRENAWRFEGKPALATVSSEISFDESNIGEAVSWIAEKIGAPVTIQRKGFGQVTFTKKRINQGFNYMPGKKGSKGRNAIGQALTTACVAAPEIVMNGDQIGHHSDHKGTGIQTWTFAGPVEIDGERGIMAVVVRRTNQNYYKVHRILTPSGDIMVLDNNKAEVSGGGSPENRTLAQPKLSAEDSIADVDEAVNSEAEQEQVQKVQYSIFVEDPETLKFLDDQEKAGKVVHTYKSFLEIDGKLYPPMASMKKDESGKWKMTKAMEVGRWEESVGNPKNIIIDQKNGKGYFNLKKDNGDTVKAAYNPYQHSSNLMINDQFTGAYSRPNLVTYECIIPESELTSGYRAEYAKDAVGVHSWKAGPVAGKIVKQKGVERQVYLSRWLKPIRKVPDAEVAQHYKELLDGTDIAVPSNVVPPSLLRALEDAGVKIEYDPRAPKAQFQMISEVEETDRLVAVHNKSVSGLRRMLKRGGVPFPSIAIKRAGTPHQGFGDVSIIFPKSTIDPKVNRQNRLYSNDAWTPTEPRTEYEVDIPYKIKQRIEEAVGSDLFTALNGYSYLDDSDVARALENSTGNLFEAMKGRRILKYAYLKSIGKEPEITRKEADLDGSHKYKNEQLLKIFEQIPADEIENANWDSEDTLKKISDVLNEQFLEKIKDPEKRERIRSSEKLMPYSADKISIGYIKSALLRYRQNGNQVGTEIDTYELDRVLRDNTEVEKDPGYKAWIEKTFGKVIKNEGIPNGKDPYTSSGNRRSFKQTHVPATLENIVAQMQKEQERGIGLGGINLRGAATRSYKTVEEMRADRGRLLGERVSDDVYDSYMKGFYSRLHDMSDRVKTGSGISAYDSAEQILLEVLRDSTSKAQMGRKLQAESRWIRLYDGLTDNLWQLRQDVQNMPAPYFEAKPRRIVYPEEALAYIIPDSSEAADVRTMLEEDGRFKVLTYKAGDEEDRLRVLNSVEGAQFQRFDDPLEGQMGFADVERSNMHPAMRARLDEAEQLTTGVKMFFRTLPEDSEYGLSQEQVESMMDFNLYSSDITRGDMTDPTALIDAILDVAHHGGDYRRRAGYRLVERLLNHVDTSTQHAYIRGSGDNRVKSEAFADWYEARHPSLYYPGYKPGDLFEHKYDKGGKADNIQREKEYLHSLLESGNLVEPELSEAREFLNRLNNPGVEVFYQQWDDTYNDNETEAAERETAYSRLQSENAILSDALKALQKVTAKQENTIGKLQQRLKLTKTPEVRESDARKLAASLIREAGSKVDRAEIAADLKAIGDYMLSGTVDENNLKARAREVARKVLSQAEETVAADSEQLQQIRNNLEGKKIYLDQSLLGELDQAGGFDAVKNRLFGRRVYLSRSEGDGRVSVDELYETLHADFGEAFFPEAGTRNGPANAGEELLIIADVLEASGGMTSNPYEAYMGEATEEMANRIVMDALNGIMQPVETDADRWKSRRDGLNQRVKELKAQQALSDKEAARLWETVYELSIALDKADSKYRTLQAEADYRAAQLREEGAARAAEVKARERERANKQIQGLKEYYQDMQKRAKERRDESAGTLKYRAQIKKKAADLYEMLMKNDDKKHVPEVLKKPVAEFLESLNFTSKRQLGGGEETNADKEFAVRLRALERALSGQQDYIDGNGDVQEDLGGYVDISQENLQYLRDCISMIDEAMRDNREFTINQMSAAQLKQLSNFISNLNTAIRNLNSFMANARFESVREAAAQDIETMRKLGKPGKFAGGAVDRFAAWENGTPYYIMKRFGAGGKSIFDGFAKGWERMAFNAKEIIDYTEKLYSDKEVNSWKKDVHEITLSDGNKIQMTTAQIMELSMLLNREQARKHIEAGGIRIGDIENRHDVTHYHLSLEDIRNITGLLNARQVKVAKALQSFMARKGAEWGNEVSMRRFGYNFYTEGEEYYPIRTDANDRPMADTDAQMNSMFRLLNLSSSKSLNPRASNALVVGDIFDTFSDHMADMAKLNGMGLPILDAIKWFNYKERINYEDGTYDTVTMQAAMEQAYGPQAQKYFRTLMKDINGMTESGDRGVSLPGKLMSNYKIAAVGANLRVAFLQPTSYVRALTVIKPQFLVGVLPSLSAYNEAMKWSGTAVWKSLGYYDTDISKSMRGQIQHADTIRDKIANASMVLAEKGDQLTWSRLWTACKRQAKAENHNLRGEALMQKTAELFREVVYSSQVMDSTLTRSEIMRGKTNWTKMMSAFMAEPTLSYNILLDAASEYSNDVRTHGKAGAWQRNAGKVGKAMSVYVCSAAFSAVVESLADAARDDDDEKYLDKVLEALLGEDNLLQGNLAQDLTILGKLPYIKNFISVLQGYNSGDMSTTAFNNLINVYKIWEETIKLNNGTLDKATKVTYYGRMTEWGKVYKTLQALSQISGVAAANLTRDAVAIWNMTVGSVDADKKIKTYDSMSANVKAKWEESIKETGLSRSRYAQILTEANANGNSSVSQDEMNAYLADAVATQALTQEQADAIWNAQGWKKSWGEYQEKSSTKAEKKAADEKPAETAPAPTGTRTEREVVNLETPAAGEEPAGATDYDSFMKQAPLYGKAKKEGAYNAKPAGMSLERYAEMLGAADVDGNGSLKQDELGYVLRDAVMNGEISFDEAARVWASQGWSHDLGWWAAKHP